VTPGELAEEACYIEIERLKEPVGKQDQYMAAFGGMTVLDIARDGKVQTESILLPPSAVHDFVANTQIYFTGVERSASQVLRDQNSATLAQDGDHNRVVQSLERIKDLGRRILEAIKGENFDMFGVLMDEHWQMKKTLSDKISFSTVDRLYEQVRAEYGVLGGKIVGAGGGGFLMLYCPRQQRRLADFMRRQGMPQLHYSVEFQGAKIVADLRSSHHMTVDHRDRLCERSLPAEPASSVATSWAVC
jgi:D-glycero-alpha-D-manno-heptose-7-phosphate kinase